MSFPIWVPVLGTFTAGVAFGFAVDRERLWLAVLWLALAVVNAAGLILA